MAVKDRVAIVTGGGRGIGRAIALRLAAGGAKVALADVLEEPMAETVKLCTEAGSPMAKAYKLDVTDEEAIEKTLDAINEEFGSIDILVNNAGITRDDLLMRMETKAWDLVLAVNLKGTFLMTRTASRYMIRQRRGRIVNIASVSGLAGNAGQANYSASKAGVVGLTKTTARELAARNVTANAVAPGFIQTDMTDVLSQAVKEKALANIPLKRMGQPADVAEAVAFFASDEAAYITGQVIAVDGGMVM
ncbi:MAG: 3-oxoacyl-[acyl-carrier-protein] reductase [Planctomycetes bacterium]|nr:3-oxoacyl-[acyl-carrier-protein] reductase [Planctomycetota bacterium]